MHEDFTGGLAVPPAVRKRVLAEVAEHKRTHNGFMPETHRYAGMNPQRAGVGLPGHCAYCAIVGHIVAHPDYGCSDVHCDTRHPEEAAPSQYQAPTLRRLPQRMRIHKGRVMHVVHQWSSGREIQSECRRKSGVRGVSTTYPRAQGPADWWSAEQLWYPDCQHCPSDAEITEREAAEKSDGSLPVGVVR